MTPEDAQQIAEIIRHVSDRDEILDHLAAAFPEHAWQELVKITCPNCGRRQNYLYSNTWCYDCRPADQRPARISLDEFNTAAHQAFIRASEHVFTASPLLSVFRKR